MKWFPCWVTVWLGHNAHQEQNLGEEADSVMGAAAIILLLAISHPSVVICFCLSIVSLQNIRNTCIYMEVSKIQTKAKYLFFFCELH